MRNLPILKRPHATRAPVAGLLAIVLLSACAGPDAPAPTPDSGSPAPPEASAQPNANGDTGAVTIGFAAPEFERQQYEPLITAFNAQNPDMRVQFVALDGLGAAASLDQMIRQAVSAADTAAVFFLRPQDITNGLVR